METEQRWAHPWGYDLARRRYPSKEPQKVCNSLEALQFSYNHSSSSATVSSLRGAESVCFATPPGREKFVTHHRNQRPLFLGAVPCFLNTRGTPFSGIHLSTMFPADAASAPARSLTLRGSENRSACVHGGFSVLSKPQSCRLYGQLAVFTCILY